jgi:hypothetical protein
LGSLFGRSSGLGIINVKTAHLTYLPRLPACEKNQTVAYFAAFVFPLTASGMLPIFTEFPVRPAKERQKDKNLYVVCQNPKTTTNATLLK